MVAEIYFNGDTSLSVAQKTLSMFTVAFKEGFLSTFLQTHDEIRADFEIGPQHNPTLIQDILPTKCTHGLKWVALSFKLSVLKKTRIWTPFNVLIYLNDALLLQNKENKILFGPPPKKKKERKKKEIYISRIRTVAICLHAQVFVYTISPWPGYSLGRDWADLVIRTTK